jgi:methylmalonyl-CoA mutase C-terminal domain/subunit
VKTALELLEVDDLVLVVGGIVPDPARAELASMGVDGVFTPGASLSSIVDYIHRAVRRDRTYGGPRTI